MKTTKLLTGIATIAILLTSCTKQGATGPSGTNGTANINAQLFTVTASQWTITNSDTATYTTSAPGITASVISSGTVNVFNSLDNITWSEWNGTEVYGNNNIYQYYYYSVGTVSFVMDATVSLTGNLGTNYFKVVTIPPAIMIKYPNTNWHDYNQVQEIMKKENSNL